MAVIIFDFDGTFADTLDAIVQITNRLAPEFGYLPADAQAVRHLRSLSTRQILRQSQVSLFQLPFLLRRIRSELNREIDQIQPVPGLSEVLIELVVQGHRLGIVTSNSAANVARFLGNHGLTSLFEFIHSGTRLFGKAKVIRQTLKRYRLTLSEVVYVGDETRDIEAAKSIPIPVIAVEWGFNTPEALAIHDPDFLIQTPADLLVVIQKLTQLDEAPK